MMGLFGLGEDGEVGLVVILVGVEFMDKVVFALSCVVHIYFTKV